MAVIVIILACLAVLAIIALLVLRFMYGDPIAEVFPEKPIQKGDMVHIFLNGKFNRSATITKVTSDHLFIYEKLCLPIDFRGKFYAVGKFSDGSRIVYVGNRNHFKNVRLAEICRKLFNFLDSPFNLIPDAPDKISGEDEAAATTESDDTENGDGDGQ